MSDGLEGAGATLRKTVAVVDMVGYSSIARLLEQNISAASVSELNKQIQSFMTRALEQLPPTQTCTVVARTGDGIILLLDSADAAHTFAAGVHRFAKEHNDQRTEATAQRWFRVGIATGEVSVTPRPGTTDEYAGTTIANAVRLEAAAEAGEVMMDDASFAELSPELQPLYGPEESVQGKRDESFRVRRYVVTPRTVSIDGAPAGTVRSGAIQWRAAVTRLLLAAVYLIPLAGLILWEHRDHLADLTTDCDTPPNVSHSALYSVPYAFFLSRASGDSVSFVSLVGIPGDLAEIQGNVCQGRLYLADLVRSIAAQHPAEIVIDKFFGPTTCKASPQSDAELRAAVQSVSVPIVVGESLDQAAKERNGTCQVRRPQLDFASANVHRGLTLLFTELDKIPLQWDVLNSATAPSASNAPDPVTTSDTLSWTAVKIFAPDFAQRPRMKALVDSPTAAFANLNQELPRQTSTQLLCSLGTPDMRARWSADCSGPPSTIPIAGKIVVIGAEDIVDQKTVLGSKIWGYDLQGRYMQALLSGAYLRDLPAWVIYSLFGGFLVLIELVPAALQAFLPRLGDHLLLRPAYRRKRYLWVVFWTPAFLFLASLICLGAGYLPPIAVFGDIVVLVIARLLFFAAGSSEAPNPQRK
jgi:class 3 adenylate cyclase